MRKWIVGRLRKFLGIDADSRQVLEYFDAISAALTEQVKYLPTVAIVDSKIAAAELRLTEIAKKPAPKKREGWAQIRARVEKAEN